MRENMLLKNINQKNVYVTDLFLNGSTVEWKFPVNVTIKGRQLFIDYVKLVPGLHCATSSKSISVWVAKPGIYSDIGIVMKLARGQKYASIRFTDRHIQGFLQHSCILIYPDGTWTLTFAEECKQVWAGTMIAEEASNANKFRPGKMRN